MKCSASLAFHLFSPTRLINSIKHEHSCKILYIKSKLDILFSSGQTALSMFAVPTRHTKVVVLLPGLIAESVTCLATDASLTADPGVASSIQARSHTFMEIDHEIISRVILLPSAVSFKKSCCQLQAKVCAQSTG